MSVEIPDLQTPKPQKQKRTDRKVGFKGSDHFWIVCVHNMDMTRFFFRTVYTHLFTPGYSYVNMIVISVQRGWQYRSCLFSTAAILTKQNVQIHFICAILLYILLWTTTHFMLQVAADKRSCLVFCSNKQDFTPKSVNFLQILTPQQIYSIFQLNELQLILNLLFPACFFGRNSHNPQRPNRWEAHSCYLNC